MADANPSNRIEADLIAEYDFEAPSVVMLHGPGSGGSGYGRDDEPVCACLDCRRTFRAKLDRRCPVRPWSSRRRGSVGLPDRRSRRPQGLCRVPARRGLPHHGCDLLPIRVHNMVEGQDADGGVRRRPG